MQKLIKHIDGEWFTSYHDFKGFPLEIKMRENHGSKIHIWNSDRTKVLKTFRFYFATEDYLLNRAKNYINNKLNIYVGTTKRIP